MGTRGTRRIVLAAAVLVLAAAAVHVYAWYQWRISFGSGSPEARLAASERAAAIEPWNAAWRARPDWVRGEEYARTNRPANAYYHLLRAFRISNADPRLAAQLHKAYEAWYTATTWKAHAQHALEQTGGILLEKDHIP